MIKKKFSAAFLVFTMLALSAVPAYAGNSTQTDKEDFADALNKMVTEYDIDDTEIIVDTNNEVVYTDGSVTSLSDEIGISRKKEEQVISDSNKTIDVLEDCGYIAEEENGVVTAVSEYASGRIYVDASHVDKTYGAVLSASDRYTVLQYESPEEAKAAGEKIEADGYDVMPSFVIALEEEDETVIPESIDGVYIDNGTDLHGLKNMVESGKYDDRDVTVAIIDTGVNDYFGRDITSYNFTTSESSGDSAGHGTKVASVVADSTSDNVSIISMKVFDDDNNSDVATIESALLKCIELGDIDVINISIGIYDKNFEKKVGTLGYLDEDFIALKSLGTVVSVSAGNEAHHTDYVYPAGSEYVWTVTAIDTEGTVASYANYGKVDFAAKGLSVVCINDEGQKVSTGGTSFATPYVTAMAANYKGESNYEPDEIYDMIKNSCVDLGTIGKDEVYGYGCISYEGSAKDFVVCQHASTKTSIKMSTCTSEGYTATVCRLCGEVLSKTITEKKDHTYKVQEETDSTCVTKGYTLYKCSKCNDEYKETKELDGDNHESIEEKITKESTCTESGTKRSYCSACGTYTGDEETVEAAGHDFTEEIIKAADCSNKGIIKKTCSVCGYSETEETEVDGNVHGEITTVTKEATCTEDGYINTVCGLCGKTLSTETVSKTGHDYKKISETAGTCVIKGHVKYECGICKDTYEEETEFGSHNYEKTSIKAGTCSAREVVTYTCGVCGNEYEEETDFGSHDYEKTSEKTGTCSTSGIITYTCSICGDERKEDTGYTDTHENVTTKTTAATCVSDGSIKEVCLSCGEVLSEKTLSKTGHSYDEGTVEKEATCVSDGVLKYTCTVCGETKTESIPATGNHMYDDGVITKKSTCVGEGEITYTCTACGDTKTESVPATEKHTYDSGVVTKEPTCVSDGVTTYTCTVCKDTKTESIPATGNHMYDDGVITKKSTCVGEGEITYTCTVCKDTKTESIPATGKHTYDSGVVTKEPTCANEGMVTYTCEICKNTKTESISATGKHAYDSGVVTKEPTCVSDGVTTYTCTVCKDTKTESIPATEKHTYDDGVVTKEPTCVSKGEIIYTCTVCKNTKTESIKPTGVHTYGKAVVTKEATCESTGEKVYTCSVCGNKKYETIPKTGHAWQIKYAAESCITEGLKMTVCSVCGKVGSRDVIPKTAHKKVKKNGKTTCITCGRVLSTDTYKVLFDSNGGKTIKTFLTSAYGETVKLPTTTRAGYTFVGWTDGKTTSMSYTVKGNITLKAVWKKTVYRLTVKSSGKTVKTISATAGNVVKLPVLKKKGYTFAGWYIGGKKVSSLFKYGYSKDVIVTAKWKKTTVATPKIISATGNKVKVKTAAGAVKYQVKISKTGAFANKKVYTSTKTTIKTSRIVKGKTWVAVRSVTKDSAGKYVYSKWVKKKA